MQYNRCLLLAIFVNISKLELCWQAEVKLAGRKCIFISDSRLYIYIKLRSVECCLADFLCVLNTKVFQHLTKCILGCVPHLIIIMVFYLVLRVTQRQHATIICDAKILVCAEDQVYNL